MFLWNKTPGTMIRHKKRLGQHFLKNKKILEEMARAADVTRRDLVLEVGPGTGTLTEVLAERAGKVIAVEKDRDLIPALREKFQNHKNVEIIQGDVLKIPNSKFLIPNSNYKIVANLPYYITSRFLRIFLENKNLRPKLMVLMVQKEVAERICAKPPKMNLLALSVQAYAKPEIIRIVPRGAFSPMPKVDSAIIKISEIRSWNLESSEKKFWEIARLAFQQKRKMLRRSIGKKITLSDKFAVKRPQELSLEEWSKIYKSIN